MEGAMQGNSTILSTFTEHYRACAARVPAAAQRSPAAPSRPGLTAAALTPPMPVTTSVTIVPAAEAMTMWQQCEVRVARRCERKGQQR